MAHNEKETTMNPKEIGIILKYCHELSRLVSPADASRYGLSSFDGSVCDFLKDISKKDCVFPDIDYKIYK